MKNVLLASLAITVLALGGWIIYDRTKSNSSNTGGTNNSTSTANVLDLSNQGITVVGPSIYDQTSATTLILSNNNIKTLPSQMGRMTKVQVFKIDHNLLDGSLIAEIRQMPQLTLLDVSYNNMTGMPAEIGQLSKLVTLNYSYNQITGLPNQLANLRNNLREFDLTGNPLSQNAIDELRAALPNTNIIF
jgi:Leucine-rich repeat (LRR) protein